MTRAYLVKNETIDPVILAKCISKRFDVLCTFNVLNDDIFEIKIFYCRDTKKVDEFMKWYSIK